MATNDKYDRQLRLWGARGQRDLGDTKVIAVGTSAAGTETLKNLILPGIGAFCVMDFADECDGDGDNGNGGGSITNNNNDPAPSPPPQAITDRDVATNFFLPREDKGVRSKAEAARHHLGELNPDVHGSHRNLSLAIGEEGGHGPEAPGYWTRILEEETAADTATTTATTTGKVLVVASDLVPPVLEALAEACHGAGHPLLVVTAYGLIGCVRLQLPPGGHPILRPKPTNAPPDLRLVGSFPAFETYAESLAGGDALSEMDSQQHGHVPYPVLLVRAMEDYRKAKEAPAEEKDGGGGGGGGKPSSSSRAVLVPKTFAEKQDFVNNYLKPMARNLDNELNFQEAVSNAYLAYTERDLAWMDDEPAAATTTDPGSKLGQLRAALETFLEEHDGQPPVNGSVPDMTASTDLYVRLQKVYRDKARDDLEAFTSILRKQQQQRQAADGGTAATPETVTDEDVADFCANVYSVGHLRTRSLHEEYNADADAAAVDDEMVDDWKMALMDPYEVPVHTPFLWYLGLRACQVFCHRTGRYPGCVAACGDGEDRADTLASDAAALADILFTTVLPSYKLLGGDDGDDDDDGDETALLSRSSMEPICQELARYGNAEVHTVASVVGGVASQEAVKLITGQYVPLNNTYVYNGIVSVGGVYRF